ncbi:MAG: HpaII family restriction endonuclease [Ruminococcus sp.]|nr:HpaII family restriction endonuclease [Ruminococcus sp.]MCM1381329.1 HpaII family restriction endonuclease [Muribaculaceae bacterium]MCM1479869.1 HpaII family restriction endonuclease [Muribaculaceae bacterium]
MTGNIGEWSELYALFKLLADGKLYAADENTNKIPEIYYDILKVLRSEKNSNREYRRETEVKVINADTGDLICSVPIKMFIEQTDKMLAQMKAEMMSREDKSGAFELPEVWNFAETISCQSLKAKSQDKADIHLMVHDIMSGRDDTFGFSIKSQLGSPSTLFNASGATNFIYTVTEHMLTQGEIDTFNGMKKFKQKFDYLYSLGAVVEFDDVDNKTFDFNLKMVTSEMPEIFAEMIKVYYEGRANKISEITEIVAESGIVNTIDNSIYLKHKVKTLLTNIALGMVPNTLWTGDYEATGGYIIVKEDGDVVCYHIYNRNAFMNYMFDNTRFDTPSQSRHGFGKIYEENGWQLLKLNTQIRFVK